MSECSHTKIVIEPGYVKVNDGIVSFGDMEHGNMWCESCKEIMPVEDLSFYSRHNISVIIPADLVDKG